MIPTFILPVYRRFPDVAAAIILWFGLIACLDSLHGAAAQTQEHWPAYTPKPEWIEYLDTNYSGPYGRFHSDDYLQFMQEKYERFGDYLNFGKRVRFYDDSETTFDPDGVPMAIYLEKKYYNPVLVAQFAIALYGQYVLGQISNESFLNAANKLISLQSDDGGFRYPIELEHNGHIIKPGWVSAMAQGQALSVFARAFKLTDDSRYREAAERALAALLRPVESGGGSTTMEALDPSLKDYVFYAEYPVTPDDFTLNGFLFTLLGLYDWSEFSSTSLDAFQAGMRTVDKILPYYDIAGYSTYDLRQLVTSLGPSFVEAYHGIHIYLLHALNSISPTPEKELYERRWKEKIDELNKPLHFYMLKIEGTRSVGETIKVTTRAAGGVKGDRRLYQFAVKFDGKWTYEQPYSESDTFLWTPEKPGEYYLGFYAKNAVSTAKFDNFRFQKVEIARANPPLLPESDRKVALLKEIEKGKPLQLKFRTSVLIPQVDGPEGCGGKALPAFVPGSPYYVLYNKNKKQWTAIGPNRRIVFDEDHQTCGSQRGSYGPKQTRRYDSPLRGEMNIWGVPFKFDDRLELYWLVSGEQYRVGLIEGVLPALPSADELRDRERKRARQAFIKAVQGGRAFRLRFHASGQMPQVKSADDCGAKQPGAIFVPDAAYELSYNKVTKEWTAKGPNRQSPFDDVGQTCGTEVGTYGPKQARRFDDPMKGEMNLWGVQMKFDDQLRVYWPGSGGPGPVGSVEPLPVPSSADLDRDRERKRARQAFIKAVQGGQALRLQFRPSEQMPQVKSADDCSPKQTGAVFVPDAAYELSYDKITKEWTVKGPNRRSPFDDIRKTCGTEIGTYGPKQTQRVDDPAKGEMNLWGVQMKFNDRLEVYWPGSGVDRPVGSLEPEPPNAKGG